MVGSGAVQRYTTTAIVLHWLIALAVIGLIGWGWWMQAIPKDPPGPRADAFNLHKSIGLTVLLLMLTRSAWRASHPPPVLPPMPAWQARTARGVHLLLYACLFVQPVSGYLGSAFSGYPVRFFGMLIPAWAPKSVALKDAMSALHFVNSWVLVTAVGVHLMATLYHQWVLRDGLLWRMWPRATSSSLRLRSP